MNCPICKNINLDFIYQFTDTPAMQNKVYDSLERALKEKKISFDLYGCKDCGFIFNAEFNPEKTKYSSNYDNTQDNSAYFSKYIKRLAEKLNKKYNLKDKNVVEIGCGKGGFVKILYEAGIKNIKGFDPTYLNNGSRVDELVVKKYFDAKDIKDKADFIICRHTLEHIFNLAEFISSVEKCLKKTGVMYFEFPCLEWIIKNKAFFDFFYEHCNYFSKRTTVKLFQQLKFRNIVFKYGLNGQYFQLEISRGGKIDYRDFPLVNFNKISQFLDEQMGEYKNFISGLDNFVIWGAGAKGVTFLNRLGISRKQCKYVIDINPNKNKKFIPVTGQMIVFPEIIKKGKIDNIIIMNPIYEKEIKILAKKYNYKGNFISI